MAEATSEKTYYAVRWQSECTPLPTVNWTFFEAGEDSKRAAENLAAIYAPYSEIHASPEPIGPIASWPPGWASETGQ